MPRKPQRGPKRPRPSAALEHNLYAQGYPLVAGLDEVGRGALAGPLVLGAIILPPDFVLPDLADSKQLSAVSRERLAPQLITAAISFAYGVVSVAELNQLGLGPSLHLGAKRAIDGLSPRPNYLITDGKYPFEGINIPQQALIKADQLVRCVAAASVIAKVYRDQLMRDLHATDSSCTPFLFDRNKGYGTAFHLEQLQRHGPSSHHRRTFRPVQTHSVTVPIVDNSA